MKYRNTSSASVPVGLVLIAAVMLAALLPLSAAGFGSNTGTNPGEQANWTLVQDGSPENPEAVLTLTMEPGFHAPLQKDYLYLRLDPARPVPGLSAPEAVYSPTDQVILDTPSYERTLTIRLPLVLDRTVLGTAESSLDIPLLVSWQICNDQGMCYAPVLRKATLTLTFPASSGAASVLPSTISAALPNPAIPTPVSAPTSAPAPDFWLMLLFAFLGGLILNVMPCVLPVLGLKVFSLAELSRFAEPSQARRIGRARGAAGAAGMVAGIMALAVLALVLRSGGQAAGWGFQFQNPHFVLVLTLVIFGLGLSMLGVYAIRAPGLPVRNTALPSGPAAKAAGMLPSGQGAQGGRPGQANLGIGKSFGDGLLMVVLATPCTAPFMGTALGFALAASPVQTLLVFFALGLGLAAPFLVLAWFPFLRGFLPKPGAWMEVFKQIVGFALLGTAAWLGAISLRITGLEAAGGILGLLVLLGFALWLWGQAQFKSGHPGVILRGFALLSLILGAVFFYPWTAGTLASTQLEAASVPAGPVRAGGVDWQAFSPQAVQSAQAQGLPVFVDFGAAWCITCGVNEKGILSDPAALKGLADQGTVFLRGDLTRPDAVLENWMALNGRAGVPFYQVIRPDGSSRVLPELLGPGDLEDASRWAQD